MVQLGTNKLSWTERVESFALYHINIWRGWYVPTPPRIMLISGEQNGSFGHNPEFCFSFWVHPFELKKFFEATWKRSESLTDTSFGCNDHVSPAMTQYKRTSFSIQHCLAGRSELSWGKGQGFFIWMQHWDIVVHENFLKNNKWDNVKKRYFFPGL